MRIYQVHCYTEDGISGGFSWFTSKRDAQREVARWERDVRNDPDLKAPTIRPLDIKLTRAGILSFLRMHASHPDNG